MSHKPIISPVFDQPGAKFVLMPIGKKFPPIETEWQNKGHSFQEAAEHKGNMGIMAGNDFIGLDLDDPNEYEGLKATQDYEVGDSTRSRRVVVQMQRQHVTSIGKAWIQGRSGADQALQGWPTHR